MRSQPRAGVSMVCSVPRQHVRLPVVVAAKQRSGRADALLTAAPAQRARMPALCIQTQMRLGRFHILYFDKQSLAVVARLAGQARTRKCDADVVIATQTIAGHNTLVRRGHSDLAVLAICRLSQVEKIRIFQHPSKHRLVMRCLNAPGLKGELRLAEHLPDAWSLLRAHFLEYARASERGLPTREGAGQRLRGGGQSAASVE